MEAFNFNDYIVPNPFRDSELNPIPVACLDASKYTFTNAPTTITGLFIFSVTPAYESNNVQQTVILTIGNVIYTRAYDVEAETFSTWETTGSGSEILGTALTGLTPTSGTPTALSTILQAFNNLTFRTHGYVQGFSGAVSAGAQTINGGTNSVSTDLTVNPTSVSVPLNKTFLVTARFAVTTAGTSGATFAIGGANVTVQSQSIAVGASVTSDYITVTGQVTSTGTANPTITLTASSVTGTVSIAADSYLTIQQA